MHAIEEQQWDTVNAYTWNDLNFHQWMCFRIALMEMETEMTVSGIAVETSGAINEVLTALEIQGVKIVHSPVIMRTRTEMIVSIVVSERDYLSEMLKYLPLYERKSVIFNEILKSHDRELRNTEQQLEVVDRNIFLDTAIESLITFERDLRIESVNSLRYDQRREQVSSRFRAVFDQTTEDTIKLVASSYSNGEVEVDKTDTPGLYEIKFVGTRGTPDNLDGLKKALDIIIPAHLGVIYTFTFNTWEMINDKTWSDVLVMNWNDLRIWDEVS